MKLVSKSELSELSGCSRRTIDKRLVMLEPLKKDDRGSVYDSMKALRLIFVGEEKGDMSSVRDRKTIAETEKAEMEVQKLKGELVLIKDVCGFVEKEYAIVRQNLFSLPSKLAKPLSFLSEPKQIQEKVLDEINKVMDDLQYDKTAKLALEENSQSDTQTPKQIESS